LKLSQEKVRIRRISRRAAIEPQRPTPIQGKRPSTSPFQAGASKRTKVTEIDLEADNRSLTGVDLQAELSSALAAAADEFFTDAMEMCGKLSFALELYFFVCFCD
jgi:hypothetical protein